jgi:DNA-directed RNA polymerase subunit RPC12/RpoP
MLQIRYGGFMFTPHVMCTNCQHVFASEATLEQTVICPNCSHKGRPERVMKVTGFPSLETFKKNFGRSKKIIEADEK